MKIAIVTPTYPPYGGGIGKVAAAHAAQLWSRGVEATVFTPRYKATATLNDSRVVYVNPLVHFGNAAFLPGLSRRLRGFDVVHLHYPFFGAAEPVWLSGFFRRRKGKLIVHYHMDVHGRGAKKKFFSLHSKRVMPRMVAAADKVIVTSKDYVEQSAISFLFRQYPQRFFELPNGVDINTFAPGPKSEALLQRHGIASSEKVILFVGGLDRAHYFKGVEYLLQAVKLLRLKEYSWKLLIVGEGDLKQHYQDLAAQLRLTDRVVFAGYVPDAELADYYNLADVVTLPSIDSSEAFGMVLIEAMACGKPVVASSLPGVRTVIDDGYNGFLAQPKNSNELSTKLHILLSDTALAEKFGRLGRNKTEIKYSWDAIGNQLLSLYEIQL